MNFPFPHGFVGGAGGLDPNTWYGFNDRVGGGAITTWSPTDKNARLSLSNGNLTVGSGDGTVTKMIRATNAIIPSAGKAYWELVLSGNGPAASAWDTSFGQMIGGTSVADGHRAVGDGQGYSQGYASDTGWNYLNGWTGTTSAYAIPNGTYAFAYDSVAGKAWIGTGYWWGTGTPNPMTGASPAFTRTAAAAPLFPCVSMFMQVSVTAIFDAASFTSPLSSIVGPREGDSFTKLLLHCDGKPGSKTFPDKSRSAHYMSSGCTIASFPKFGNGSVYFNGTTLTVAADPNGDLAFGTGDFTIDLWFNLAAGYASSVTLVDWQPGAAGVYVTIAINATGKIVMWVNGGYVIIGTTTLAANTWYHFAVVRASAVTRLFINGVQEGPSYSDTWNYLGASSRPVFGVWGTDGTTWPFLGWMDEIRISKGIARWTANFTPPTAPYT
jgi:hypothetical protein